MGPLDSDSCGLVVFDMLEAYRDRIEQAVVIEPLRQLIDVCWRPEVPSATHGPITRTMQATPAVRSPTPTPTSGPTPPITVR